MKIKVISVNISLEKGTIKKPVSSIDLCDIGVKSDAHSGHWHRQVSLLGVESFRKFEELANRTIAYGEFAENITTEGMLLYECTPLDRFVGKDVILEVTQIGKKCHGDACAIYREVGNCVMPKEGIFAKVISNGKLKMGDELEYVPKIYKVAIITLSDRASAEIYPDKSGPMLKSILQEHFDQNRMNGEIQMTILPDSESLLHDSINSFIEEKYDIIFTTGGTGISSRDITPDVIKPMLDKELPGIMDYIRMKYGSEKPAALLSRSIAGTIGKTLIFALPGSVKAVQEYMLEINKSLNHLIYSVNDLDLH